MSICRLAQILGCAAFVGALVGSGWGVVESAAVAEPIDRTPALFRQSKPTADPVGSGTPALFRQSKPTIDPAGSGTPVEPTPNVELSIPVLEQAIYERVNRHRATLGLSPLRMDRRVSEQARAYSRAMAQKQLPFGHSDFRRRVLALNRIIPSRRISENVAYIFTHNDTANRAVDGWLKSPRHRPILEGHEYRVTGIGIAQGERGAFYITQIYIRPR